MSDVQKICPECSGGNPLETHFCSSCGYNFQSGLPMQRENLPAVLVKAALPLLAGAASLMLRVGWKFLQTRLTDAQNANQTIISPAASSPVSSPQKNPVVQNQQPNPQGSRRTVHIRSSWAVGNADGSWQKGTSEHTIEFEE